MDWLSLFAAVWLVDFEFRAADGERPEPICLCAREWHTGRRLRLWLWDLARPVALSFGLGPDSLYVAFYASAELGCHLALGWPMPVRVLDLFAEFRNLTNGLATPCGSGLLGALAHFGLDARDGAEKASMRDLAGRGGPFTADEQAALLDYCASDVDGLANLLPAMAPQIDLPRALLRGRYMAAAARMEWNGVPLDADALADLRTSWGGIKAELVRRIDADYGVFIPAGQRTINPDTPLGAAILQEAATWEVDAHRLADAVDYLWREERESSLEIEAGRRVARSETGLTARRIDAWENAGRDYAGWPGLDVKARELAGRFPALGIGTGYTEDGGPDDTDYAALLWESLRTRPDGPRRKDDPALLARAAEMVHANPAEDLAGPLTFSAARWAGWLSRQGIPWPRLASGALDLSDDAFRLMARTYRAVGPMRELRHALSQLRLSDLAVGADGRNRCLLSAFRARTGRNQPSNSRFIFGPSVWLRCLIRPAPCRAVAYVDWSQQEFGIAAALSGDRAMMDAYVSGDPYLTFAKQAGAVPREATKQSHAAERDRFKVCALAVQYGMEARSLAQAIGQSEAHARELLRLHRQTYPTFWRWSQGNIDHAMLHGWIATVFGWRLHVGPDANPRSLANFPMQANGAEMLRLACCLATERGIPVCAPVHDAVLVEGPAGEIESIAAATQGAMREAAEIVLAGFALRSDAKIVRHPARYADERGRAMWDTVWGILRERGVARLPPPPLARLLPSS